MAFEEKTVREYVESQGALRWVKAEALLDGTVLSCVDGRDPNPLFGTPGGSAGDLVVGLAARGEVGRPVDPGAVPEVLEAWLSHFGGFYMHADTHDAEALPAWMRDGLQDESEEAAAAILEQRVKETPEHRRPEVLEILVDSAIGCGHLKLMRDNPELYGVPRDLWRALREAFFQALWRGEDVRFPVLSGAHAEGAVCHIVVGDGALGENSEIPAFRPKVGDMQSFIVHPQAVALVRGRTAPLLDEVMGSVARDEWLAAAADLWGRQAVATLSRLAPGLPVYELRFSDRDTFDVVSQGHVPSA